MVTVGLRFFLAAVDLAEVAAGLGLAMTEGSADGVGLGEGAADGVGVGVDEGMAVDVALGIDAEVLGVVIGAGAEQPAASINNPPARTKRGKAPARYGRGSLVRFIERAVGVQLTVFPRSRVWCRQSGSRLWGRARDSG